jgi:hypothetical protein
MDSGFVDLRERISENVAMLNLIPDVRRESA